MNVLWNKYRFPLFAPDGEGGGGGASGAAPAASSAPSGDASVSSGADSSGATSASPAPAPGGDAETSGTGAPSGDLFDFSGLSDLDDDGEDVGSPAPAKPEPKAPPKAKEAPKADAKAPPAADKKQPPEQDAKAAAAPEPKESQPTQPGDQSPPYLNPAEPARLAEALSDPATASALIDHLASTEYRLSAEDVEALETDAPAAIPKLLARVHHKLAVSIQRQFQNIVPAMIKAQAAVSARQTANESQFYAKWPDLNQAAHGAVVNRYAQLYRQANPQATLEQMIEELGPMVMIAAKVQPGQRPVQNGNGQHPMQVSASGRTPPPSPFKPAVGGPGAPPQPVDDNPWGGMSLADADDD